MSEKQSTGRIIPIWIMIYAGLQIITSFVGVYSGYFDLSAFYSQFPNADFTAPLVSHLGAVWASKNVGIILVMTYALIRQKPLVLATALLMKFVPDTADILYSTTAFLPESNLATNIITWLILGLPQGIAAYLLYKQAGFRI